MKRAILTSAAASHFAPSSVLAVPAEVIAPERDLNALRQSKEFTGGKKHVVIAKHHP
jgi:hypothetical protein